MTKSACSVGASQVFWSMWEALVGDHHVHLVVGVDIYDGKHKRESDGLVLLEPPVANALSAPLEFSENSITQEDWVMSMAALRFSSNSTVSSMIGKKLLCRR